MAIDALRAPGEGAHGNGPPAPTEIYTRAVDPRDPKGVAVVGAGRVGTALAILLGRAGHSIVAVSGRDQSRERAARHLPETPFLDAAEAAARGEIVLLGVPDDRIAETCETLVESDGIRPGQTVVHLSGSTPLRALDAARSVGARPLSLHPLQTFPDVDAALARLPGSGIAVTGDDEEDFRLGERLAADAGGRPFRVPDDRKPLYHAAAVFCSSYLAVVEGVAERLFAAAGVPEARPAMAPLAEATLANVLRLGPAAAVTGPTARGDTGTIRRNLGALEAEAPDTVPAYVALATAALDLSEEAGRLGPGDRARVEEVLDEWR